MKRRQSLLLLFGAAAAPWARSATEWSPWVGQPPLYIEGEVTVLTWAAPQAWLQMVQHRGAVVPADLAARDIARHRNPEVTRDLLRRAVLPVSNDRMWHVRLPTLAQLLAWGVDRPQIGHVVGVVGHAGPRINGFQALQAELLFTGARGYPLHSEPL